MLDRQYSFNFAAATCGLHADQHHNLVCSSEIFSLPKIHAIYRIVCLCTSREYIGSATFLRSRILNHYRHLKRNNHCNKRLQREWNKYGEGSFRFGLLEAVKDKNDLIAREQHYFDVRKPSLILCKVAGRNPTGRKMSIEGRMKLSLARKGKPLSEETRRKLSVARRRRVITMESRIKQSLTWKSKLLQPGVREALVENQRRCHFGKSVSAATRALISAKLIHKLKDPSVRKKMSDAAKARFLNPEYKARFSAAMSGRVVSEQGRISLSESHKGKPWSASRRAAYNARFNPDKHQADYTGDDPAPDEGED